MEPLHFFLPLGGKPKWDNNELRYCLRSLEKNCKYDFDVTIYSTEPVEWLQNVDFEVAPRFYPEELRNLNDNKPYENFYDTLNKVRKFASTTDKESFIYIYDDVCLLKELEYCQFSLIFALHTDSSFFYAKRERHKHGRTINSAVDIYKNFADKYGFILPVVYNYETHLPREYNRDALNRIINKMIFGNEANWAIDASGNKVPPSLATVYFNMTHINSSLISNHPYVKAEFFMEYEDDVISCSSESYEAVLRGVKDKWWLNYNDMGLNDHLKRYIMETFPNKSRFEK